MKATIHRQGLLDAFALVSPACPSRSPKPILSQMLFRIDPDAGSTLAATDLEVGIRCRVLGVKADAPGAVVLPTQRFGQLLKTSTDEELLLETGDDGLTVRGARSRFTLAVEDPALFPEFPAPSKPDAFAVAAADYRTAIRRTIFSTDVQATRYALGGVLHEFNGGTLRAVATDGRRLATQEVPALREGEPEAKGTPVVPTKALKLIDRCLDGDAPVLLTFDSRGVHCRSEGVEVYARLVEGRFPRYQDVFPASAKVRIDLDVAGLMRSVEQAAVTTSDESRGVDFTFGQGVLKLNGRAADAGSSEVEFALASAEPEAVEISFDPRYLLEGLRSLGGVETVTAELTDGKQAAVFRTGTGWAYVVMPLTRER